MVTNETPACAHSIVRLVQLPGPVPHTHRESWACCDCGQQFAQRIGLIPLAPGPSYLHERNDALRARVAELEAERASLLEAAQKSRERAARLELKHGRLVQSAGSGNV